MKRGGVFYSRSKRDLSSVTAIVGIAIISLFVLLAIFADLFTFITGNDPYSENPDVLSDSSLPTGIGGISSKHWFGVTPLRGIDLFAIISHGARISLGIGLASTAISVVLGVVIGVIAGYFGGFVDFAISRIMDVFFGFPFLIFAIALSAIVPQTFPRPLLLTLVNRLFWLA